MNRNPFEELRLGPSVSEEEIVRQAGRLRQRAADEAALDALRRAAQSLTARTEDRQLFALLTHDAPCYEHPALERFASSFRRPVAPDPSAQRPALDIKEFERSLCVLAAKELQPPPLPFEAVDAEESPEEIERQTAEAEWRNLLFNPGA